MLTQYVDVFTANQISGPVLLDISLEDLDYMEVKALGHRKVILKGIEDLRQNKVVTKQLFASSESTNTDNNSRSRSSEVLYYIILYCIVFSLFVKLFDHFLILFNREKNLIYLQQIVIIIPILLLIFLIPQIM